MSLQFADYQINLKISPPLSTIYVKFFYTRHLSTTVQADYQKKI